MRLGHGSEVGPAAPREFLVASWPQTRPAGLGLRSRLAKASEVEIRFTAEGPSTTLVELEHSKLERHGEGYEQLRELFDGPGAWQGILELFARKIAE